MLSEFLAALISSFQFLLSELYAPFLVFLLPRLLSFFHKCVKLNCIKSASCYYALFFPKKITFSKEDESPILIRAFAFGGLFWLIQAAPSSSISIILFSSLISFEHKAGTILDSFDIWSIATSSPATGLPDFAAETLRAPAWLSALYLIWETMYI